MKEVSKEIAKVVFDKLSAIVERSRKIEKAYFMVALMNGKDYKEISEEKCWSNQKEFIEHCINFSHQSQDYIYKCIRLSKQIQTIVEERPHLQSYGIAKGFVALPYVETMNEETKCSVLEATQKLSVADTKKFFQEMKGEKLEVHTCTEWQIVEKEVCKGCGKEKPKPKETGKGIRYSVVRGGKSEG